MTFNWTDGPELSILLVRENGRDYAAEVAPHWDESGYSNGHDWQTYRDERDMSWGWSADRDTAKREAEQALTDLIEKDFNDGGTA